jgi:hypothetical protein
VVDESGRVSGTESGRDDVTHLLLRSYEVEYVEDGIGRVEDDESDDSGEDGRNPLSLFHTI